jgi:hypothetical protein|tara:strand:- start:356 stop:619 length:264 start_codon:yes stop_codon:yes gene_type:complete
MNITVLGQLKFMSEPKEVKGSDGEDHSFKTLWLKTLEDSYIAVNCWDDLIKKTSSFELGEIVTLDCKLESHRNKKKPTLFYHKVLLR